jgi:hypothetical protein
MFRLPSLVLLSCAIAGASTLSWNWDVFQPANSLISPRAYGTTPDAINSLANSYPSSVGKVANWLPPVTVLSDLYSASDGGGEIGIRADGDLRGVNETVPSELDRSNVLGRPQIADRHRVFGSVPAGDGSY